jgi:hypothetical protein
MGWDGVGSELSEEISIIEIIEVTMAKRSRQWWPTAVKSISDVGGYTFAVLGVGRFVPNGALLVHLCQLSRLIIGSTQV